MPMTFMKTTLAVCGMAALLLAGNAAVSQPAQAQAKKSMSAAEKRAKSKECSAEADKRGLHGKKRRAFRSKCRRGQT